MRKMLGIAAAVSLVAIAPAAWAQHHGQEFFTSKDIKWGATPSLPGAKFAVLQGPMSEAKQFVARIQFPDGYRIPPHFHSGIEHVTVISGTFAMGHGEKFDQGKLTPLKAGDVAIMQPKTPHYAMTTGATEVQIHGVGPWTLTYVNPKDDPRNK
jgi:quercetin dioxygenase-like cupin family protein